MPLTLGNLTWLRAVDHLHLLAEPTAAAVTGWAAVEPAVADQVLVTEIDPGLADTAAMTEAYDLPLAVSANCVLVAGGAAARSGSPRPSCGRRAART